MYIKLIVIILICSTNFVVTNNFEEKISQLNSLSMSTSGALLIGSGITFYLTGGVKKNDYHACYTHLHNDFYKKPENCDCWQKLPAQQKIADYSTTTFFISGFTFFLICFANRIYNIPPVKHAINEFISSDSQKTHTW